MRYDTTKPRFTVEKYSLGRNTCFETLSTIEASFWAALGYHVSRAEWNGKCFKYVGMVW